MHDAQLVHTFLPARSQTGRRGARRTRICNLDMHRRLTGPKAQVSHGLFVDLRHNFRKPLEVILQIWAVHCVPAHKSCPCSFVSLSSAPVFSSCRLLCFHCPVALLIASSPCLRLVVLLCEDSPANRACHGSFLDAPCHCVLASAAANHYVFAMLLAVGQYCAHEGREKPSSNTPTRAGYKCLIETLRLKNVSTPNQLAKPRRPPQVLQYLNPEAPRESQKPRRISTRQP